MPSAAQWFPEEKCSYQDCSEEALEIWQFKETFKDDALVPLTVLVPWHKRVHSLTRSPSRCLFCSMSGSEEIVETARTQCLPLWGSIPGEATLCVHRYLCKG